MGEETGLRARKHRRTREAIRDAALRLFIERGFDDTAVEEIAAAADVAPRTFYRYFASKEEVIFHDPDAEATLGRALAARRPGESDVELIARAMLEAMLLHEERVVLARQIIDATPGLRGHVLHRVEQTAGLIADHLLSSGGRPGSAGRDARFRAQVLAQSVAAAARLAFFAWIDAGRRGTAWAHCERALGILRDAFQPTRRGRARNPRS